MKSRTITVRRVPQTALRALRAAAERHRRSLNSELLVVLENAAAAGVPEPPAGAPRVRFDRAVLAELCKRHHIIKLSLFGSVLRDDFRPDSDVDLLVEFEPGMTPGFGIITIQDELADLFGGRRVDLVSAKYLNRRIRDRVLSSAQRLYPDG